MAAAGDLEYYVPVRKEISMPATTSEFIVFLLVTLVLGGLAAFVSGRALARTWRPMWRVPVFMLPLALAVRFVHFSVFGDALLSPSSYAVDYAVLLAVSMLGYKLARAEQMEVQYGWRR